MRDAGCCRPLPHRMKTTSASAIARAIRCLVAGALAPFFVFTIHAQVAGWADADIGSPRPAGAASEAGGVITVRGGGQDVWGASDAFHFTYRSWSGDGDFVAHVASVQNTHPNAKAGIMFRDGLGANAVNVFIAVMPQGVTQAQHRTTVGAETLLGGSNWQNPTWLKVTRRGNVFTTYYSTYGSSWTQLSSVTVAMSANLAIGLAVTSHNDGTASTATFDNVVPPGAPPAGVPATPTNLVADYPAPGARVRLTWVDNATNEVGYDVYRYAPYESSPPPNGTESFQFVTRVGANVTSYQENVYYSAGQVLFYRVRAVANGAVPSDTPVYSAYSNIADVTLPNSWYADNIGNTGAAGTGSNDFSTYTISGAGAGFTGTADAGLVYRYSFAHDGTSTVRVVSLSNTDPAAKTGLMLRGTSGAPAPNAFVYVTPGGTVGFQARNADGNGTTTVATASAALPVYLKLVRSGVYFTAAYSADGTAWTTLGSAFVNLFESWTEAGLAVTSHRPGVLATATLDRFTSDPRVLNPVHWPTPAVPAAFSATALSGSEIQLNCTPSPEFANGMELQRSTDGVTFINVTWGSQLKEGQFVDSGLTSGTRYYYRARSFNPSAYSAFTGIVSATPSSSLNLLPTPGVTALATEWPNTIKVVPSAAYNSRMTFEIERSTDNVNFTALGTIAENLTAGTQYFDTPVASATVYYYRVRGFRDGRVSNYSPSFRVMSNTAAGAPATPVNLVATAVSALRVDLQWTDNSSDETAYVVQRRVGTGYFQTWTLEPNVTTFSDTSTTSTTAYSYRVYARRGWLSSGLSNAATVTTPRLPPEGPPAWLSLDLGAVGAAGSDSASGSTVTVTGSGADIWDTTDAFHYRYEPWEGDGTFTARLASLTDTNGWAKAGLMFREMNYSGTSTLATARHATMFGSVAHGTAFQYRAGSTGTVTSPEVDAIGPPRWLRITRVGNVFTGYDSFDGTNWIQRGTVTLSGLPNTILVGFAVTSHNAGVLSTAQFDNVSLTGPTAVPPPAAPTELSAVTISATRVELHWRDNAANETGFTVERSPDNFTFTALTTVGTNIVDATDTSTTAATRYYYRVYARGAGANSGYSNVVTVTTPTSTLAPAAPSNLTAVATSSARVDLRWNDNAANETGFTVERSTDNVSFTSVATLGADVTTALDLSVSAATTYYYRVYARGNGGNSSSSNVVTVTTPSTTTPPVAPSNLAAAAMSATRVDVTWRDNSSDETHFQVERSTDNATFAPVGGVGPNLTVFSDTTAAPSTTYYYRVYARNNELKSSYSNSASATTTTADPSIWFSQTIGTATAGSSGEGSGRVTVTGSGRDIWNTEDGFQYRYVTWTGDGEIVAHVTGLSHTNGWAKAAVMFRESITAASRHATMIASSEHGTALQYRLTTGGESGSTAPTETGGPLQWLRLVRSGSTFTGYASADGVNWTSAGNITLSLPATIYLGLAVTSHNDGVLASGTFEAVRLTGGSTPPATPPSAPTSLVASAASSTQINLTWSDGSTNETGFEVERSTDNATFTRVTTTGANATSYSHSGLTADTTYYYRVRAVNGAGASSYTAVVNARTLIGSTPPLAWQSLDIGDVAATGSVQESGGVVTLTGSGADFWNAADEFRFRYVTWSGNGEIVARVSSLTDTNGWAKAGLMFRESLASNSPHATMIVSSAHGTAFQYRAVPGGDSNTSAPSEAGGVPRWLRLVRNGNTFTGYASTDGVNWVAAGSITLALPTVINLGLAVTSHNDGALCNATFSDIVVRSATTPGTLTAPSGLAATVASASEVNLSWTDNSANETAFRIERATDGVNFTTLTVLGADQVRFRDTGLTTTLTYTYRVRAEAGSLVSTFSNTAAANTGTTPPQPGTWFHGDIGNVGLAGSDDADTATSSITVRGSGADIWEGADGFRFVYRTLTGDCLVEARVVSLDDTNGWAKAGVMIRESTAANARNVFACLTPWQGVFAQSRATVGGQTTIAAGPLTARAPYWVRLARTGTTIVASSSPDGVAWSAIVTINLELGATVQVGFAVTSHDNSRLNTAVFGDPFLR